MFSYIKDNYIVLKNILQTYLVDVISDLILIIHGPRTYPPDLLIPVFLANTHSKKKNKNTCSNSDFNSSTLSEK